MPRKVNAGTVFDDLEDDVLFSRSVLKAEPKASDLVTLTDTWLQQIDEVRTADREVRERAADIDADRALSHQSLEEALNAFSDALLMAVKKDRTSRRYLQFFSLPVSRFTRQAMSRQVELVQGWLALPAGSDDVLDAHRATLEQQVNRVAAALTNTRGLTQLRGTVWQKREVLASNLTLNRDALWETLSQRAREQSLGREWPNLFFRAGRVDKSGEAAVA